MNSGKSLGQVAFEAFYPEGDFERTASGGFAADGWVKDWERAGRAVAIAVLDRHHESIKAEGAKEERKRCAHELKTAIRAWPNHNKPFGGPSLTSILCMLADSWVKP